MELENPKIEKSLKFIESQVEAGTLIVVSGINVYSWIEKQNRDCKFVIIRPVRQALLSQLQQALLDLLFQ